MHEVQWTPEKVRVFWDNYRDTEQYFTRKVGHSIVNYVARRIRIGTSVDYGCGQGDLIAHLLKHGPVYGVEQSDESAIAVAKRFANNPRFKGIGEPADADTLFLIEVIEHMDDAVLAATITKAKKLLRPGGHIVITTPNEEDLDLSKLACPDCGCVFHRMQHVRSWSAETLGTYMVGFGFKTVICEPTLFSPRKGILALLDRLRGHKPHLVYIGELGLD